MVDRSGVSRLAAHTRTAKFTKVMDTSWRGWGRRMSRSWSISAPTGAAPTRRPCQCPKPAPTPRSTRRPASAAAACARPQRAGGAVLGANITHFGDRPQGQAERRARELAMIDKHDAEGLRRLHSIGECTAVCPKGDPTGSHLPIPPLRTRRPDSPRGLVSTRSLSAYADDSF